MKIARLRTTRLTHPVQEFTVKSSHSSRWFSVLLCAATSMPALAQESPEAVVRKRFEATASRDIDAIAALYASDAVETSPAFCVPRQGSVGARKTYGDLFRDAPGIENQVTNFVVDGNHVAVQFVARARKPDGSIAFEVPLANFLTVEHGRIVRDDTYFDTKGRPCS
jgi:ketosteroid isomerase-like protein